MREFSGRASTIKHLLTDLDTAQRYYKLYPRLELALAIFAMALRLPKGAAAGIYTLGRSPDGAHRRATAAGHMREAIVAAHNDHRSRRANSSRRSSGSAHPSP